MKKKSTPKKSLVNEFCGERDCKLGFVHWHGEAPPGYLGIVRTPYAEEPSEFTPISRDWPAAPEDPTTAAIAKGLLDMPSCSDPAATRFKDKTPEEIRLIQFNEREFSSKTLEPTKDKSPEPTKDKSPVETQIEILREHMDTALKNLSADLERLPNENVFNAMIDSFMNITKGLERRMAQLDAGLAQKHADDLVRFEELHNHQHSAAGARAAVHADLINRFHLVSNTDQAMRESIAAWRAADEIRQEEESKTAVIRYSKMISSLMKIEYKIEQQPGFWTFMWSSICGSAVLISSFVTVAGLIILIARYTQ